MERKPWSKLAGLFGAAKKLFGAAEKQRQHALSAPEQERAFGLGKYADHPSKRMRRGVSEARERKQRPARLAWIYESCKQAREIRDAFRNKQLLQRAIRMNLRAA